MSETKFASSIGRGLGGAAAFGAALMLLHPVHVRGWSHLGGSLDLTQRDVRVFNNFQNPEANDNTTPDPSFPGAVGAPLAIWKACVEWGSERHGDGYGDPNQPGDIGSGGANFDPTWQGLASGVGGTNDNIVSEISGASLGTLAYCELPISDGWRIRLYQSVFVWEDGPGSFASLPNNKDIQGVVAHEFGHALGMGHSADPNATMYPSAASSNIERRSIESDDIAGIQALYGVRSPSKPHLATYTIAGNVLSISGANFSSANNEVWFTDTSPTADGTPLKVTSVASPSGVAIQIAIPAFAGAGDVLVKNAGNDGMALSNAFPFDPTQSACPEPVFYGTAKTTSIGTLPSLATSGRPRASTNDFEISTNGGVPFANGILFYGSAPNSVPFLGGTLLVSRPLARNGMFQFDFVGDVQISVNVTAAMVGTTRCYQLWFQDAQASFGVGLSNAVQVAFCP